MANTTLQLKKSGATGNVPSSLSFGELALNYADGRLYYKAANGTITFIQSGTTTNSFATINANSSLILATSPTDTLSIVAGNNITISACTVSKIITINSTGGSGSSIDQYARDTANGANGLAQGAYNQANVTIGVDATQNTRLNSIETINTNQNTSISIIQGVDNTQNTNITTANNAAWAAFAKANAALANVSGAIFGGNLTVTGNLTTGNIVGTLANTTIIANTYTTTFDTFGVITHTGNKPSTSNTTGALVVAGGVGVSGNVVSNSFITSTDNSSYVARLDGFGGSGPKLELGFPASPNGFMTVGAYNNVNNIDTNNRNFRLGSTAVTNIMLANAATGVVTFANLVANNIIVRGSITDDEGNNVVIFGTSSPVRLQNTAASTSNTTGALIVGGGVGVSGNVYADAIYDSGVEILTYFQGVDNTQNTRLNSIETINTNQNNSITIIQGVNITQNTNITAVNNFAQSAYNTANLKFNSSGGTISGSVIISGNNNLTVTGNLAVLGNTFSVNTQTLEVVDPMIILGIGNYTTDIVDIGFAGHYNNGTNAHTGFIRDYVTKDWYLFQGYTPELSGNNNVNINDASFDTANLIAKKITANVSATTITISGRDQASVDSTQNSQITAVNQFAQAAYNQANNAGGGTTVTISDDNTSNNVYYVNFTANTSGNANTLYVSSNNLSFIPSTGTIGVKAINLTANTNISSNAISLPNDLNQATIDSFSTSIYRGAFYQVQMSGPAGIHILNLNITHDDTSVFANTFGDAYSTTPLGTFSGNIVGTTLNVLFTPTNALTTVAFIRNVIVKMGVETPAGSLGFVGDPVTVIYDAGFDSDPTTISFDYGTVP